MVMACSHLRGFLNQLCTNEMHHKQEVVLKGGLTVVIGIFLINLNLASVSLNLGKQCEIHHYQFQFPSWEIEP